jgi:hypothetical protein
VDKVAVGQVSSGYFGFPCQFSFHRLLHIHHHLLSAGAGTIGQLVADVPGGLGLTPHQETKKKSSMSLYDIKIRGMQKRSWLRHCVTSRKVADSIPDVNRFSK